MRTIHEDVVPRGLWGEITVGRTDIAEAIDRNPEQILELGQRVAEILFRETDFWTQHRQMQERLAVQERYEISPCTLMPVPRTETGE